MSGREQIYKAKILNRKWKRGNKNLEPNLGWKCAELKPNIALPFVAILGTLIHIHTRNNLV